MTYQGAATLPLVRGTTTLESAPIEEDDILLLLRLPEQRFEVFVLLYSNYEEIPKTASYHLGLSTSETCHIGDANKWVNGGFNFCIPLYVTKARYSA
jgi:hypothetical protein